MDTELRRELVRIARQDVTAAKNRGEIAIHSTKLGTVHLKRMGCGQYSIRPALVGREGTWFLGNVHEIIGYLVDEIYVVLQ
jgi:hypothetical protein